jgi:hypothetical protein
MNSKEQKFQSELCPLGAHDFPNQEFVVGPRVCDRCGAFEYEKKKWKPSEEEGSRRLLRCG